MASIDIGEIFRAVGRPDYTYVEPKQFDEVKRRLSVMGEGLVIEGPSGAGKTTLARAALASNQDRKQRWLSGTREADRRELDLCCERGFDGYLIVDDFHRLDRERQARVADLIKVVADEDRRDAKIILIGINPVGFSLVNHLPDLAGRFIPVSLTHQPDEKIEELISKGERAGNLRFEHKKRFVEEAAGSFIIAQMLCYEAAVTGLYPSGDSRKTPPSEAIVVTKPSEVTDKVQRTLADKFRPLLVYFASCDERPPPRGACVALLWELARSKDSTIRLTDVRLDRKYARAAQVQHHFDWILSSQLAARFAKNPGLEQLLYYDAQTTVLSIDDPRLNFYLNHLDWRDFAAASGHEDLFVRFSRREGPVFRGGGEASPPAVPVPSARETSRPMADEQPVFVLHLSDLHFSDQAMALTWRQQLSADLRTLLGEQPLHALVISGDIGTRAQAEEYREALEFLRALCSDFRVTPDRVVLVPGNHDLSWELSEEAYRIWRRGRYAGPRIEGRFFADGNYLEVRDEGSYGRRFEPFAAFYRDLRQEDYSLEPREQATLHYLSAGQVLILGLNSAWEIDHHFRDRASINPEALGRALSKVAETETYRRSRVKLAVCHHPLHGEEDSRIRERGFAELLAQAGFQLVLHGHIHKARNDVFRYSATQSLEFLGAGTFGAASRDWVPGYPLQYQLLRIEPRQITVETRMRTQVNGAWGPDARWLLGPGQDPRPRYVIPLGQAPS